MAFNKISRRRNIRYRIRKKVRGSAELPRLSVFRSNKEIYCQIIDDLSGRTLAAASSVETTINKGVPKVSQAAQVGKLLAQRASEINITKIVFDRSGYLYHGRVKALADGAREGGLIF